MVNPAATQVDQGRGEASCSSQGQVDEFLASVEEGKDKYWMKVNQEAIQQYLDFRDKHNVPVWMGESGENTDEWIASFRTLLEQHHIGWYFWPYKKLDATSCVASINPPADWAAIVAFANGPRTTFEEVRKNRPPKEKVEKALSDYLERIKFENCRINTGYLKALGLKAPQNPASQN